jgi:O-antigen/teichoic acid export membrane protein
MSADEGVSYKDEALKAVVKGAGISFIGLVTSNVILYLNRLVLARYLGVDEYGLLYLGISILNLIVIYASLELSGGITRYAPYYAAKNDDKRVRGTFLSALKISLPTSIAASLALFFFSDFISAAIFHNLSLSPVLKIFSVLLPFYIVYMVGEAGLLAFKRMDYCALIRDFFKPLLIMALMFTLLFLGFGLEGAAISYSAGFAGAALIFIFVIQKKLFPVFRKGAKSAPMGKKMLKYSLPIVLYYTVWASALRVDTIFLGALRSASEVGLYQTALPTSQFLTLPSLALASLFLPVISELLSKKKHEAIKETYKIVSKWSFYLCFPMFLVLLFWPDAVINTLFGGKYIAAGGLLGMLSIGLFVFNFSMLSTSIISLLEKTKYLFVNGAIALTVTVFLNYVLISMYGAAGAALAMTIVYFIITSLSIAEAYHFSGAHPFHKDIFKAIAAGLISVVSVYFLTKTFFGGLNMFILSAILALFLALYCLLLLMLKGVGKEDIMILKAIEKKTGLRIKFLRTILKRFI